MHEYIYKLNIIGGMALIPLELTADDLYVGDTEGILYFREKNRHNSGYTIIAWYPVNNTIIRERLENPDHVAYHSRPYE